MYISTIMKYIPKHSFYDIQTTKRHLNLYTALRRNVAHLGHKKLTVDSFEYSFVDFFLFKYVLTQAQVLRTFYPHKINIINVLQSFLMSDNIIKRPLKSGRLLVSPPVFSQPPHYRLP